MAVIVAQTRAGDEQHRVGERVTGHHEDQAHTRDLQFLFHGRGGDVDDRYVQGRHEHAGQHDGEGPPALLRGQVGDAADYWPSSS